MRRALLAAALGIIAGAPAAMSGEAAPPARTAGPLAGLPSAPGAHIAKIKAMADDSWLELGSPAADPKWGKARGRSWTPEMILAPEMRGAFFMGTGVHAFVKPDGHYQDDLWFYDINAHRWTCLHPGTGKDLKLKLDERGFEVNDHGEPIPVDATGHATCNSTYDTDRRKYMFMPRVMPDDWVGRHVPQRAEWLAKGKRASCRHPWVYDPVAGKWDRRFVEGAGPDRPYCSLLNYVPPMKRAYFLYDNGKMWSFDWEASKWTRHETKGDRPIGGYNFCSCYDSKRARIVQMFGDKLWFYDPATDTGTDPKAKGQEEVNARGCNESNLTYDVANDVIVLYLHKDARRGLYFYDCRTNAWTTPPRAIHPEMLKRQPYDQSAAFYDPELNVHFYFGAGDSRDNGIMWVYRCKRADKQEAK